MEIKEGIFFSQKRLTVNNRRTSKSFPHTSSLRDIERVGVMERGRGRRRDGERERGKEGEGEMERERR